MLVVRNIRVHSLDRDALTVTWNIADTVEDLSTYQVAILRSESQTGPYDQISPNMIASDVYRFDDRGINMLSKWREFFYRVRVTNTGASESREYGSAPLEDILEGKNPGGAFMAAQPDLEAVEAINRFRLVCQEYGGRELLYLRERTWGQRCTDCYDPLTRRLTSSKCETCFRTGFSGGFFPPSRVRLLKPPHEKVVALTPLFEMQPKDVIVWMPPEPRVKPRDLLVNTELERFRVISVKQHEKGQALTRMTVQLRALTRDQIEYKIPIRGWNEDNMSVASHRQYIRATDIDSYRKAAHERGFDQTEPNQIEGFPAHVEDA